MNSNDEHFDQFFKIVLVGDSGVGKTNLLLRYTEDTFVADSKSTIGVDFSSKIVVTTSGERVKVQFWDTAGQERFKSVGLSVMRGAQGFILVYDMTCRQSFQSLTQWMNFVKDISGDDCRIIILANKSDLFNAREVRYEEAKHFASKNGVAFVETSALNGNEVSYAFERLVEIILEQKEIAQVSLVKEGNSKKANTFKLSAKKINFDDDNDDDYMSGCCIYDKMKQDLARTSD